MEMHFSATSTLTQLQKIQILELWNNEYPKELSLSGVNDFNEYLDKLSLKKHILLADLEGQIKGWLMYFNRDNERCFAMILATELQGKGWGTKFLNIAKESNSALNGWVIDNDDQLKSNGENYLSPIGFYRKNGFRIHPEIQLKMKKINGIKVTWKAT